MDRHEEVLSVLRARASLLAERERLEQMRGQAAARSNSLLVDAPLFARPSAEHVDEQWTRAFIRKGLALDLADDKEFRKAMLMTARAGLSYVDAAKGEPKLPHRTKMTTMCIPTFDQKLEARVSKRVDGIICETGACFAL